MFQGLNFSGVNAHHKNCQSERHIISIQDLVLWHMIHSNYWCTSAIRANPWTYAIRHASSIRNETNFWHINYKSTPIHMFSKSKVYSNPRHWKLLFCHMYELYLPLAADQPFDKRKDKITTGIYLGISQIHARIVALVLRLSMRRVSPHFHVEFDPYFTTINVSDGNIVPPSYW